MSSTTGSIYDDSTTGWVNTWTSALLVEPATRETISSRLNDLLKGKIVNGVPGSSRGRSKEGMLNQFHALFDVAKMHGWTEIVRDDTYFWTEQWLLNTAWDAPDYEGEEMEEGLGYDNAWIMCAMGDARLFALGYGYSPFAWNALLDGLGLGDEAESDSMRIGACAQLLGAGNRIKLFRSGGGNEKPTPGFAGRYLDARPKKERSEWEKGGQIDWTSFLKALVDQQQRADPKTAALLKLTHDHLIAGKPDLTSAEVAEIIWPTPKAEK
ncbi:unnamed protein product [Cyclocybe aegerita]|uniref:Uncharacterized protein n=1 Tax=Cyclocybe aegerita TaxID=1973307 RepID=A0A8S0XZ00_CYCAE|nr:unnamed protein product [Cyclocybe aegerita]